MRDNQQYLIGERIDGAFGFVQSYAGAAINSVTSLFIPWVYKQKGFDGSDYSVLDVYQNYDETLPLSQQKKNPNCVLFPLMDTLLLISVVGAAIDVLPWFAYDISETGQKSMIRVIRIRTIVEDRKAEMTEDSAYIEGCEAVIKARKYHGLEKKEINKHALHEAKKSGDKQAVKEAKKAIEEAKEFNEEVEIADFVMREINRFETDFGKKQLELCRMIAAGGPEHFFDCAEEAIELASRLPTSRIREEKTWRKQETRNARALLKSRRLAAKYYPNGIVPFDHKIYDDAYDMPDDTREQAKLRRKAMKEASKQRNNYGNVAAPYLSAVRTIELYEGYNDLDEIISNYDDVVNERNARHERERKEKEATMAARALDREQRQQQKKLRTAK